MTGCKIQQMTHKYHQIKYNSEPYTVHYNVWIGLLVCIIQIWPKMCKMSRLEERRLRRETEKAEREAKQREIESEEAEKKRLFELERLTE